MFFCGSWRRLHCKILNRVKAAGVVHNAEVSERNVRRKTSKFTPFPHYSETHNPPFKTVQNDPFQSFYSNNSASNIAPERRAGNYSRDLSNTIKRPARTKLPIRNNAAMPFIFVTVGAGAAGFMTLTLEKLGSTQARRCSSMPADNAGLCVLSDGNLTLEVFSF